MVGVSLAPATSVQKHRDVSAVIHVPCVLSEEEQCTEGERCALLTVRCTVR